MNDTGNDAQRAALQKIATCGLHIEYTPTCRSCRDRYESAQAAYACGAADARAEENEACAKIAESFLAHYDFRNRHYNEKEVVKHIGDAIRARQEKRSGK